MSDLHVGTSARAAVAVRPRHMYVVGPSGSGKSSLLDVLIAQALTCGHRVIIFDRKGPLATQWGEVLGPALLATGSLKAPGDIEFLDLTSPTRMVGLNPLLAPAGTSHAQTARAVVTAIRGLVDGVGERQEGILRNATLGVLAALPEPTLADVLLLLDHAEAREALAARAADPSLATWLRHFARMEPARSVQAARARLETLLFEGGDILCAPRALNLDVRSLVAGSTPRLTALALPDGPLGSSVGRFLGAALFQAVAAAVLGRPDGGERLLLVLDEFQDLVVGASADAAEALLAKARSKNVAIVAAHQYAGQLSGKRALLEAFKVNAVYQFHFRPTREVLRESSELLPMPRRRRDPERPDQLESRDAARRRQQDGLTRLPERHCLHIDHLRGTATPMRVLDVPYGKARRRAEGLPERVRHAITGRAPGRDREALRAAFLDLKRRHARFLEGAPDTSRRILEPK